MLAAVEAMLKGSKHTDGLGHVDCSLSPGHAKLCWRRHGHLKCQVSLIRLS